MDLAELMNDVTAPHAIRVTEQGERLIAIRLADDWDVGLRLHRKGSYRKWNVMELVVRLRDEDESINGNSVRELPLGALIEEARRLATKSAVPSLDPQPSIRLADLLTAQDGRFGASDDAMAALAFEYVTLVEAGNRKPSRHLADRFGGSPGAWTNRVAEARSRGFLSPAERGEAGGSLTPKTLSKLNIQRA
jgi:hypothetical protein